MMSRLDALKILYKYTENIPVISSCGNTSREWAGLGRRDNHLYMVDTMGLTPSVAIGVSLALEKKGFKKCIGIEGDGGVLMNPNSLASASYLNPKKWMLIVFDNECFASTGGQCSLASRIDIAKVAEGFNLKTIQTDNTVDFEKAVQKSIEEDGPILIHVKINQENQKNPFINDDPAVLAYKFSSFLNK
ncbi:thiamine pyrophosphate-dependent enzyme [Cytobacillus firmus]|uniref:thiamine pyrophosphate-dependent enzyme n=1 Tax=Cytobacillus firmus TaxID=1399 RepID=UPI002161E567|nr:thiamine pyrophosphate-dependent enzyme [Cytobacillus firmus]MCS0671337.1 thiamine pyrophosphate-dependent enzyme [Cytobacillus firmus]